VFSSLTLLICVSFILCPRVALGTKILTQNSSKLTSICGSCNLSSPVFPNHNTGKSQTYFLDLQVAFRYALSILVLSVIDTHKFDATCIENGNHVIDEPLSLTTVKYKLLTCSNEYQHTLIIWSSSVIMCAEISQRNKNNHVGFHPTENQNQVNKLTAQHALLKLLCKNKRTFSK